MRLTDPAERVLAMEVLDFERVIVEVAESMEFHRLAQYLYTVATAFSRFYERCPVLRAEPESRRSRLRLCDLTRRTLAIGLAVLGIETPIRM